MEILESEAEIDSMSSSISTLELQRTPRPTLSPLPVCSERFSPLIPPRPTPPRRRPSFQPIPSSLVKPGTEMLKVSAKSTRRVQTKKVWLELGTGYGPGDVKFCWEKNGRGVGESKRTVTNRYVY